MRRKILLLFCLWLPSGLAFAQIKMGATLLAEHQFELLQGKRVGLITNHTAMLGGQHVIDLLFNAPGVKLTTLFGPEHGLRGLADAGAKITNSSDPDTGLPIYSLYGATRKPTPNMLKNVDVLVFDIQDVGARFYTYISTMALAMQAAAENGLEFMVLDRPNPIGGTHVSGYLLEPAYKSFVGQFNIPVVHGMTVGELAQLIKGERLMTGLENLNLTVVKLSGWMRTMHWQETGLAWIKTSPNIPDEETALIYPGTCLFEGTNISEGRGTLEPFKVIGAPWANGTALAAALNAYDLPGVAFEPVQFTPRSIQGMASSPKMEGRILNGVRVKVTNSLVVRPFELGIFMLATFYKQAPRSVKPTFFNRSWLANLAGTDRLYQDLISGKEPVQVVQAFHEEVARFSQQRAPYLLY